MRSWGIYDVTLSCDLKSHNHGDMHFYNILGNMHHIVQPIP